MHPVSFMEIGAADGSIEAKFFSELFGWPWQKMGDKGEGWFEPGAIKIGLHGNDDHAGVIPYFRVAEIDKAAEKVIALGGTADFPGADEPGFGRFVNCVSAQGVRFGLHQPPN
jgi:uncharacterized protein